MKTNQVIVQVPTCLQVMAVRRKSYLLTFYGSPGASSSFFSMMASCLPSRWQTSNSPQAVLEFLTSWHSSHWRFPINQDIITATHHIIAPPTAYISYINLSYHSFMQSPTRLNKINPRLSGSRREEKSYTDRYRLKAKPSVRSSRGPEEGVSADGGTIGDGDPSIIRIEDELDEYQVMKNEYMETELMWSKMAGETRGQISDLREQIKAEQKAIKDMEKVLTAKRARLSTLTEKQMASAQVLQNTPLEDYLPFIANLQQEYDSIDAIGERQMAAAKAECAQLAAEAEQLQGSIQALQSEIDSLAHLSGENYNGILRGLLEEQERLRSQVVVMEQQSQDIARSLRELQSKRPIKEEVHRKYLQLYEKMFVNRELDKMAALLEYKQQELKPLEDYGRRKGIYRQRRKEIEEIEYRISKYRQTISQLELQVRDRSTHLLNLHASETQKR